MRPKRALLALAAILSAGAGAGTGIARTGIAVPTLIARAQALAAQGDCPGALGLLDPLAANTHGQEHITVQSSRLLCLLQAGRLDDAAAAHHELLAAEPDNPMARSFGLLLAAARGKFAESADQLVALATEAPRLLNGFNSQLWTSLSGALSSTGDYARRYHTALALARANWQPADGVNMTPSLAPDAVRALITDGKAGEAEPFLADIGRPEELMRMATDRRYAALWPAIEERLGPRSGKAIDRYAVGSLSALAISADDPHIRREAVEAFEMLNRHADAEALSQQVPVVDGMGHDDLMAIVFGSEAQLGAGDADGALDRLRALTRLKLGESSAATDASLYLANWLLNTGRDAEALAEARAALSEQRAYSPGGVASLRRVEACALQEMDRTDEAGTIADSLHVQDNPAAVVDALLCTDRFEAASAAAVAILSDPERAGRMIDFLQPDSAQLFALPTPDDARRARLAQDPAVKAAFDKAGRVLPRALWPMPGEQPLPKLPDMAGTA